MVGIIAFQIMVKDITSGNLRVLFNTGSLMFELSYLFYVFNDIEGLLFEMRDNNEVLISISDFGFFRRVWVDGDTFIRLISGRDDKVVTRFVRKCASCYFKLVVMDDGHTPNDDACLVGLDLDDDDLLLLLFGIDEIMANNVVRFNRACYESKPLRWIPGFIMGSLRRDIHRTVSFLKFLSILMVNGFVCDPRDISYIFNR